MKKSTLNKTFIYLFGTLFIIVLWTIISFFFDENDLIFPSLFKVLTYAFNLLHNSYFYLCLFKTLYRVLIGFIISLLLALFFGTFSGISDNFRYFIEPTITFIRSVPTAPLILILLVAIGALNAPIYIVIFTSFPVLYESTYNGYANVNKNIKDIFKLDCGNSIVAFVKIFFPSAIPYILVGIVSSFGLSFKIEIMAEVLIGSSMPGLGSAISTVQRIDPTNVVGISAYAIIAVIIVLVIDLALKPISSIFKDKISE